MIFGEAAAIAAVGVVVGFAIGGLLLAVLQRVPQFQGCVQASESARTIWLNAFQCRCG